MTRSPQLRIGNGFDIHPVSTDQNRVLKLAGVEVAKGFGLLGHSDADVVCHALADAVLGAVGLGGIGDHFPPGNPVFQGADSLILLSKCMQMVTDLGWELVNADVTVIAQQPRLAEFLPAMSKTVTEVLGGPVEVKAKSPESIGALGANQGIAALASALLWRPDKEG